MAKAIHLPLHKLGDPIVMTAIKAFNFLREEREIEGNVSGGMAVQSYLPEKEHRGTIDLDLSLLWGGTAAEFRELFAPFREYLEERGYDVGFKKRGKTYDHLARKGEDAFLIQHQRRSEKSFGRRRSSFEREVDNQRIITKQKVSYPAQSPEDLAVRKIVRMLAFADNYDLSLPRGTSTKELIQKADGARAEILGRHGDVSARDVMRMRMFYDGFDVRSLAKHAGLNKNYFSEAVKDWVDSQEDEERFYRTLGGLDVSLD